MQVNEERLQQFMGRLVDEMGSAMNAALVVIGDRLGLYKAMTGAGPVSAAELAAKTKTNERHIREWLSAQAAGAFLIYDPATERFTLPDEHAMALAVEDSACFVAGAYSVIASCFIDADKIAEAFKNGKGLGWHEHHPLLFEGTDRFFRPGYSANLTASWIPSLNRVEERLRDGARVADVGCGFGSSTIIMAQAYPKSRFLGFDYHEASIERARRAAEKAGVADRVTFETASAKAFPGRNYDFVTVFDCLHDMGDPVGAVRHIRRTIAPDGVFMIVEPFANNRLEENLNPVGRIFYSASTMICTPASLSQELGAALGAQAGEERMREVVTQGGFSQFRRAAETPFNLVYEARP